MAGTSARTSNRRLLESPGQFTSSRYPSIFFYVAAGVFVLAAIWAGTLVMRLAQSVAKFVGFAIVVAVVVIAGLFVLGQIKVFG